MPVQTPRYLAAGHLLHNSLESFLPAKKDKLKNLVGQIGFFFFPFGKITA